MLIDAIVITLLFGLLLRFSRLYSSHIFYNCYFIGLIAAVKLSAVTANYLRKANLTMQWLLYSFALVMFVSVILVRILAKIIQRTMGLRLWVG